MCQTLLCDKWKEMLGNVTQIHKEVEVMEENIGVMKTRYRRFDVQREFQRRDRDTWRSKNQRNRRKTSLS